MNIVFCHTDNSIFNFKQDSYSYNSLPTYFFESVRQVRFISPNSNIYVICNEKTLSENDLIRLNYNKVKITDQDKCLDNVDVLYNYYINSNYDKSLANFNFTGISRYFIVENFMRLNNVSNVLYMEYDNLIYIDPDTIQDIFNSECLMSKVNDYGMCCGVAFFKTHNSIGEINKKILEILQNKPNYYINDMYILSEIYRTTNLIKIFKRFPEEADIIIDPCSYGQYIGGTNNGHNAGFISEQHDVGRYIFENKPNFYFYDDIKITNNNKTSRFFSIHVHNKNVINQLTTYDKSQIDGDFFEHLGRTNKKTTYSEIGKVENVFDNKNEILITHNGDRNVTDELYDTFQKTKNYKYWFAQNTAINRDNLITLPIGLERRRNCKLDKFRLLLECKELFNKKPEKILYANFSISTNCDKRHECIQVFNNKSYLTNKVQYKTPHNSELTEKQYIDYCNDILNHKFVLCPEGNGIDTHRLWETFYLGRIPVVLHNHVNDSFSDMPILIVNKWEEFEEHINDNILGSYDKLTRKYWYERILKS